MVERVLPQSGLNSANSRVGDMPTGKESLPPKKVLAIFMAGGSKKSFPEKVSEKREFFPKVGRTTG